MRNGGTFPQYSQEKSFSFHSMRQKTINRKILSRQISYYSPLRRYRHFQYLRTQFISNPSHIFLIFFPIISAGTINQQTTGFQSRPYIR